MLKLKGPTASCFAVATFNIVVATVGLLWLAILPLRAEQTNGPLKRVLILYSFGREFAPFSVMSATFRAELARQARVPIEFHEESIETARFEEVVHEGPMADYLQTLFRQRRLDLIVTMGGPATLFVNRHRGQLFPDVPVLATMDQRRVKESGVSTNMIVVPVQLNLPDLIEDILQLLPATKNVLVVMGTSPFERYWTAQFQHDFAPFTNRLTFTYWNDLSLEAMAKRISTLPPNSAVLYGTMVLDAAGVPHEQETALAALHASSNAPIFGLFEHQLGLGIVGGRLTPIRVWGQRTAEVGLRILNGEPLDQIKSQPTGPEAPVYDWRELRRWGINEARLPPGSVVRFRVPTTWEQHRWQIIGIVAFIVFETALIIALVWELRGRRLAEAERQRSRDELAHVSRVTTMGELASTLAHEINQPLGAILRNAEAAELFMQNESPDLDEVRAILTDIRKDDQRAGAVIDRMKSMLKRHDLDEQSVDVAALVGDVASLVYAEAAARQVKVDADVPGGLPPAHGDRVQLQQVLLNLILNGMDALSGTRQVDRCVTVTARLDCAQVIEIAVSDSGPGIPAEQLTHVFDSFFTTKKDGMGMGLPISRTIIEAHGGRLWAENNEGGGATFRFTVRTVKGSDTK